MRTAVVVLATLLALPGARAVAGDIEFEYTVATDGGAAQDPLKGFDKGPANLQVKLKDSGYVYIVVQDEKGGYRVAFPQQKPTAALQPSEKLPPIKLVHVTNDPGVQRVYLVVSKEPIAEFDGVIDKGGKVTAVLPLEVRDRYSGDGLYTRETKERVVSVKYKASSTKPAVVEEITLRHPVPPKS